MQVTKGYSHYPSYEPYVGQVNGMKIKGLVMRRCTSGFNPDLSWIILYPKKNHVKFVPNLEMTLLMYSLKMDS